MDHRISKDMISSGMIPSGEKNQEDLSRTQYGTAPSPNALSDVYKKMYEKKEETLNEHHKKDADGNTIPHEDEEVNEGKIPAGLQAYLDKKKGKKEDKKDFKPFLLSEIKRFLNEVIEDCIQENPEGAEIYKLVSNEVSVPKDSLWQYLTKDHLDHDNKLSDEQWETFVNEYGGHFAEGCTDLGDAVLSNFLDDISDDEPTEETQ